MPGGIGPVKQADAESAAALAAVKAGIEAKSPGASFEVHSYATQVVAGLNFFLKVKKTNADGTISYAHVRVFRALSGDHSFHSAQPNKQESDPIEYF